MKESYTAHPNLLSAFHLLHLIIIKKDIVFFVVLEAWKVEVFLTGDGVSVCFF